MSTPVEPRRAAASGWGSRAGLDVTAVFTGYLFFLFAIPATMIVAQLGTLGAPATILSLLGLVWYLWYHLPSPCWVARLRCVVAACCSPS